MSSPKNDPFPGAANPSFYGDPLSKETEYDASPSTHVGAEVGRIDPASGLSMDVPGMIVMGHTCYACGNYTPKIRCVYCGWRGGHNGMIPPSFAGFDLFCIVLSVDFC